MIFFIKLVLKYLIINKKIKIEKKLREIFFEIENLFIKWFNIYKYYINQQLNFQILIRCNIRFVICKEIKHSKIKIHSSNKTDEIRNLLIIPNVLFFIHNFQNCFDRNVTEFVTET